jgi:Protein of unknown function DUF72
MDTTNDELPPQAARLAPKLRYLAERGVYFGASSWKYEGWLGSIYSEDRYLTRGKHSKKKFEETCLTEYARTFPTVCGDFAFYQFPSAEYWDRLFSQTPRNFLFGLKVPEDITVSTWPKHARYGARAGHDNEHFLDARMIRPKRNRPQPGRSERGPQCLTRDRGWVSRQATQVGSWSSPRGFPTRPPQLSDPPCKN